MGCKQTRSTAPSPPEKSGSFVKPRPPPVVNITAPPIPAYVKSVLKKSHQNGNSKTRKLLSFKREPPPQCKSVNFDDEVRVKARTPTPRKTWYQKASSTMPMRKHIRDDDDDENEDDYSSISSAEEVDDESMEAELSLTNPARGLSSSSLPHRSSSLWYKSNSIGVSPSTRENTSPPVLTQPPSLQRTFDATNNPSPPPLRRIKVRRKTTYPILPTSPPPINHSPQTIQFRRPLPNTNTLLIEHRPLSMANDVVGSPPTAYYAFSRRPIENGTTS